MKVCKKCGANIEEGAQFCEFCGEKIESSSSADNFDNIVNELNNTPDSTAEFDKNDIENNKIMGILSYLGLLVFVPIFAAKDSKFARFHANQGLMILISGIILGLVSGVIAALPFIGFIALALSTVASISIFALEILGIVNVVNGKAKELPIIGKYRVLR